MKNIEQILKEVGIEVTDEQKASINKVMPENYKTIAEFDKQTKKLEAAEADRDNYKNQLDTANETLEKFKDIDPEKQAEEIEKYKQQAKEAQETAAKQILERDQRDWLENKLGKDGYNIKSPRAKSSIISDILSGNTGAKWDEKTKQYFGIDDLMKSEKKKDPYLYESDADKKAAEEEAKAQEEKDKAAGTAPKYTDRSEGKPVKDDKNTFKFNFNPIREVKKAE